jgi:hypothetical protein
VTYVPGRSGVPLMEPRDQLRGVHVGARFPTSLLNPVPLSSHQILETLAEDLTIQDLLNLPLQLAFDDNRRGRRFRMLAEYGVVYCWGKFDYQEDQV